MTHPQVFGQKFAPIRRFLAWKTHPFWPQISNMIQYGSALQGSNHPTRSSQNMKGLSSHGKAILQLYKITKLTIINGLFLNIKISENLPVRKTRDRLYLTISLWITIFEIYQQVLKCMTFQISLIIAQFNSLLMHK